MNQPSPTIITTGAVPSQTISVDVYDEYGEKLTKEIACEQPLTVMLNWQEVVTLMTLGARPAELVLGYLKNQHFVTDASLLESVIIDWETKTAAVNTKETTEHVKENLKKKTVTSGCGQGTMFGSLMDRLSQIDLAKPAIKQSQIYALLKSLNAHNDVYRKAGAVHGCALCRGNEILTFVEDVGRHNAVDTIAGYMWLEGITGADKWFYTTGRLTSEMIIKVAQMGVPVLLSRSGVTQMGLELAQQLGVVLIARAKGRHFLVYHGVEQIEFDEPPKHL